MPVTQRDIALDMLSNPDNYSVDELIDVLRAADDEYHNDQESFIEDNEYDALRMIAHRLSPTNPYFIGVGSDVRGGKIKLPFEMGSLDQVEIGDIQEWIKKNKLQKERTVITDKMDGTSAMIVYDDDGCSQIAYSRGNGTEGADITRHIFNIENVPSAVPCGHKMVVRAEVELTETAFEELRTKVMSRSGKPYKNARNMVAGLMNSKKNPAIVYKYLTVIAYEVIGFDGSKTDQLELLENNGFQVVKYSHVEGKLLTDDFLADFLNYRRKNLDYAIDGVVIDVDSKKKRDEMNPTRDTLNPAYSIKYKVADASNMAIATVVDVEWNVSKHGYLKPRVKIEPVDLVGVTVQHATGFNAKFIIDNKIGKGAQIRITRSGDVIPFILEVVKPARKASEPKGDWSFNETGVDAVLNNRDEIGEVAVQQVIDFFASIDAPNLKEGTIRKLFEYYDYQNATTAILSMLHMDSHEWVARIGTNGKKVYNGLRNKMSGIALHVLMGSLPYFGRGVGKRKFKKLEQALGTNALHKRDFGREDILDIEGFQEKTVDKIMAGYDAYWDFYKQLPDYYEAAVMEVSEGGSMEGEKVVFTGFRDKELHEAVEAAGGEMQSGVSGKTTILVAKNPTSNSGKMKKARDKGVRVMGIDEFKTLLNPEGSLLNF